MIDKESSFVVRRIVVVLDPSSANASVMESAIHIAGRVQAELLALLVEDSDLLRLSQLPLASEVRASDATLSPLSAARLERALRVRLQRTRQTLERAAAQARVRCVFETVRGKVSRQGERVGETDLLIVGPTRHLEFRIARARLASGWPLIVFFDGSEGSWRALEAGAWICRKGGGQIVVHAVTQGLDLDTFRQEVPPLLDKAGVTASFQFGPSLDPPEVLRAARSARAVPVLARRQPFMSPEFLSRILEVVEFAVVTA